MSRFDSFPRPKPTSETTPTQPAEQLRKPHVLDYRTVVALATALGLGVAPEQAQAQEVVSGVELKQNVEIVDLSAATNSNNGFVQCAEERRLDDDRLSAAVKEVQEIVITYLKEHPTATVEVKITGLASGTGSVTRGDVSKEDDKDNHALARDRMSQAKQQWEALLSSQNLDAATLARINVTADIEFSDIQVTEQVPGYGDKKRGVQFQVIAVSQEVAVVKTQIRQTVDNSTTNNYNYSGWDNLSATLGFGTVVMVRDPKNPETTGLEFQTAKDNWQPVVRLNLAYQVPNGVEDAQSRTDATSRLVVTGGVQLALPTALDGYHSSVLGQNSEREVALGLQGGAGVRLGADKQGVTVGAEVFQTAVFDYNGDAINQYIGGAGVVSVPVVSNENVRITLDATLGAGSRAVHHSDQMQDLSLAGTNSRFPETQGAVYLTIAVPGDKK